MEISSTTAMVETRDGKLVMSTGPQADVTGFNHAQNLVTPKEIADTTIDTMEIIAPPWEL